MNQADWNDVINWCLQVGYTIRIIPTGTHVLLVEFGKPARLPTYSYSFQIHNNVAADVLAAIRQHWAA
jgi:hypothetical protein